MNPNKRLAVALLLALAPLARRTDAADAPDFAARGLDVFVHMPTSGPPRSVLPVQVEAIGFPTAVATRGLAGVTIEAVWNPEALGKNVAIAPPPVRGTTDGAGRVHLDVPIPDGDERDLDLLVGVRSGAHARTRSVKVKRIRPNDVALFVPDRRVVPGSTISAWVLVTSATTGSPVGRAPVTLSLGEGGVARFTANVTTDASGTAMARVPIPDTQEPTWTWRLSARTLREGLDAGDASTELTPRDETPGKPSLRAQWDEDGVLAGDKAHFVVHLRDASDQPVGGAPVRYWIGPKGTEPPIDPVEWEKVSKGALTSPAGEVAGDTVSPSTVVTGVGTSLRVVVRAQVEGRDLSSEASVNVGAPAAEASLEAEAGVIVPGLEQRMLLSVVDGKSKPVSAPFVVEGDGLLARVRTDANGEAEVTWRTPVDLGAMRNTGPCAGGVAAAVRVRAEGPVPALDTHPEPFELCVKVDRELSGIVVPDGKLVRAGDKLHVRILSPAGKRLPGAWSLVATNGPETQATSVWIEDGEKGGDVPIPEGASGVWSLSAAAPGHAKAARITSGAVLVTPRVLPKLDAKIVGGRATPGGAVELEAVLADATGRGLPGTVSAVMIDRHGGGSIGGLGNLDTRGKLCGDAGVDRERCDRFVEGDAALEPLRRALLGRRASGGLAPETDPEGRMQEELRDAFRNVVHSLEGAVFESSQSAEQLRDVRRRGPGGAWQWNPELMTLVTASMDPKPTTPGGEPLALADLMAIDPQVSFSNVARRITRLKLFRVLAEMRKFKLEKALDADEPALKDPNAMLRRLVRDGRIDEPVLVDPWGGSLRFVRTQTLPVPFLTVSRGWELRSPGPDGQIGNGDDVRDPFERVLTSGSPYAVAVQEDKIVDAKWDMEVAEQTVSGWQTMFEELTGTSLGGRGEGIGLGGIGTIGHGSGGGSGQGSGAGHGRLSVGNPTGVAFWSEPVRTDAQGRAKIHVPLGDIETTWRIALVGVPDGATPATTSIDVPSQLPLASRVDVGTRWVEGDSADAIVTVRNRTGQPARARLVLTPGGVAEVVQEHAAFVDVPANGVATTRVRLRARVAGEASLDVITRAPGIAEDVARHTWEVRRAGEAIDVTHVHWIDEETELSRWLDAGTHKPLGPPRLVLERGVDVALSAALEALDPDRLVSATEMADALEVASRLRAWGMTRGGEEDILVQRAAQVQRRATGRLSAYARIAGGRADWPATARATPFVAPGEASALPKPADCPTDETDLMTAIDGLDAEPPPVAGGVTSCWDGYASNVMDRVDESGDPVALARALLALADRPHRALRARDTALRLRHVVGLAGAKNDEPIRSIAMRSLHARDRASRAIVYAGLVRTALLDRSRAPELPHLMAWVTVQRDASGGYGSSAATRAAVRAILAASPTPSRAKVVAHVVVDGAARDLEVPPSGLAALALPFRAKSLVVTARGVVARVERPALRAWNRAPTDEMSSTLHAETTWPAARAGRTGVLRVVVRHDETRTGLVDLRIPLPPGVTLAENVPGVRQVQGILAIRHSVDGTRLPTPIEVPVRFSLAGTMTVPEAQARYAFEPGPRTVIPARPLSIAGP